MSEAEVKTNPQGDPVTSLEPEQKTNPQGDPITSVAVPKSDSDGKKDPHADAKKQKVVTPEYLFLDAPRTKEFITGSEAAKEAIRRSNVDMAIAYPITPQSETMQLVGVLYGEGYVKEYYRGEEEVGVMAAIAGGSRAGVRCFTATAGPGTLRGLEGIASWPGHRLPAVAMFTCRVVNAPLAIQPDNIEIAYLLNCGMIVFHAENQQDMYDFIMAGFIISEKNDVTLPVGVCCDGFFVTHARGYVRMQDKSMKLPPREAWRGAVPVLDAENPPARLSRDAPVQKSNFMAYNIHAVWQQEVWAAVERSRKYIEKYMGGLCTAENVEKADAVIIASGSAAAQSREAVRLCAEKGIKVGLIKVRSLRPFPTQELRKLCKDVKLIVVPEFNYVGWLAKEVAAAIYGHSKAKIIAGPHVYGGQSMPVELILDEVESGLTGKKSTNVPLSAIMGVDDPAAVAHFMRSI
ncbi:MAG: ferredoxin oxidoreductase [Nitrospirae bacterium RIFCSPLOWO2_02_FULL_62_14]|nr:MAG: ferredoxin oxidoreductase [Nitrospirae bacterium RIFCSPLOWO2_02_FULL_62_14]OGW69951.1 MAG: ferredoxin oxidoreductase [Nitrospirae bacterium RIFCSPLOWO2_01_FULL_62_17]